MANWAGDGGPRIKHISSLEASLDSVTFTASHSVTYGRQLSLLVPEPRMKPGVVVLKSPGPRYPESASLELKVQDTNAF